MAYTRFDADWTTGESITPAALDHIEAGIEDAHDLIPTTEAIQDLVAAMFTGGSHTGVTVTYDDTGAVVNLTVTASGTTTAHTHPATDTTVDSTAGLTGPNVQTALQALYDRIESVANPTLTFN